jgi:hypothetical protein
MMADVPIQKIAQPHPLGVHMDFIKIGGQFGIGEP